MLNQILFSIYLITGKGPYLSEQQICSTETGVQQECITSINEEIRLPIWEYKALLPVFNIIMFTSYMNTFDELLYFYSVFKLF